MSTAAHHDSLPEHPDSDLIEYRPISGWAVAALLLGLASLIAVAHPLLWSVPLTGVVVSLLALRRIDRSEVKLVGRKAAMIGLALACIYGIGAPVRAIARDRWLRTRAERLGEEFIAALRAHQIDEAFAMTLQSAEKAQPRRASRTGEQLEPEGQTPRELFLSQRPVGLLLRISPDAKVERFYTQVPAADDIRQPVFVYYRIDAATTEESEPTEFMLHIEQIYDGEGIERWWISAIQSSSKPRLDS